MFKLPAHKEPRIPGGFQLNVNDIQSTVTASSLRLNEVLFVRIRRTDVLPLFKMCELVFFFLSNR